uniref:Uncharacterized protein n=1 Tax=Pithovirus LCPAC304 TaxID=2506594 RepID=A0A481Z884_9VIRU|nr:MAG: hypothetical protein LCPAC304_04600 [Pithovirus LCPAC304]
MEERYKATPDGVYFKTKKVRFVFNEEKGVYEECEDQSLSFYPFLELETIVQKHEDRRIQRSRTYYKTREKRKKDL